MQVVTYLSGNIRNPDKIKFSFTKLLLLITLMLIQLVYGQNQQLNENQLYNNIYQDQKTFKFYQLRVSNRFFTGRQYLAFKVLSADYDSDPDIFISKINEQPKSTQESEWYCLKRGSDTCIINRSDINVADIFFIGIRCINQCRYNFRAMYVEVMSLEDNKRVQYRLDGFSTNIFEYQIPRSTDQGQTNEIQLSVESESDYSPIETYLSLNDDFYQIEDRSNDMIREKGRVFRFSSNDQQWCTNCFVYLLVDVIDEGRYYIRTRTLSRDITIEKGVANTVFVPAGEQFCVSYFVERQEHDLVVLSSQFQGDAEFYIASRQAPTSIEDARVRMRTRRNPHRAVIISSNDRSNFQAQTGQYSLCLFAYTDTSSQITALEESFNRRFIGQSDTLYTANVRSNNFIYFSYSSDALRRSNTLRVRVYTHNLGSGQTPQIFFKICDSTLQNECYLSAEEGAGTSPTMSQIGTSNGNINEGIIFHNPRACRDPNYCFYLISIYNQHTSTRQVSVSISYESKSSTQAMIGQSYRHISRQNQLNYYVLNPNSSLGHEFADAIILTLRTYSGDADLYVSNVNRNPGPHNYTLRSTEFHNTIDRVIVNRTAFQSVNEPLYIAVLANQKSAFELSISAHYHPTYIEQLSNALPLMESQGRFHYWLDEFQESFYSFKPWWSGQENRTIVLFADMIFNRIAIFASENNFPRNFLHDWIAHENTVAIYPNDPKYNLNSIYYTRIRPDWALQDLISRRQYIFTFFAFSQAPEFVWQDLQVNQTMMGYGNNTRQFYRHYMFSTEDTYIIRVKPMLNNPILMLSVNNQPVYAHTTDSGSYHFISNTDTRGQELSINFEQRLSRNSQCMGAGYSKEGGNKNCPLWITVQCNSQCVYNITIEIVNRSNIPKYLVDHTFQDGSVEQNRIDYYYYPVNSQTGQVAIFLNKTGPIRENGDALLLASLQVDTSRPQSQWQMPTLSRYDTISATSSSNQPEILDFCAETFTTRCHNVSCALVIGVMGRTSRRSHYRISSFSQSTMLFDKQPVKGILEKVNDYHYYWFLSNSTVSNTTAEWEYVVSTGVDRVGQDVDLYVSGLDARIPNEYDNDWYSDNLGADDVYITNKDPFFQQRNYNTSQGMLYVVAVKAKTENTQYTLMVSGPQKYNINPVELSTDQTVRRSISGNRTQHYFKWFNWGHNDFIVQVEAIRGNVYMMFNNMPEETLIQNAYIAVPLNENNSRQRSIVNIAERLRYRVFRTDISTGLFCYYCFNYITIESANPDQVAEYEIQIVNIPNEDVQINQIQVNTPTPFTLSGTGSVIQRRFLLDTMDPFTIRCDISSGNLQVFVGLFSTQPTTRFIWRANRSVGQMNINVRTTNENFRIGTQYFITMQSINGRTDFTLQVIQGKKVAQITDQGLIKDLYYVQNERVKLYYFRAPQTQFTARFTVRALSPDFYPQLYLFKNQRTSRPSDFRTLTYPSIVRYHHQLGSNFSEYAQEYIHQYTFQDEATTSHTYYTLALYSHQYGLTDRTKAEFELALDITQGFQVTVQPEELVPLSEDDSLFLDENSQERQENKLKFSEKVYYKYFSQVQEKVTDFFNHQMNKINMLM